MLTNLVCLRIIGLDGYISILYLSTVPKVDVVEIWVNGWSHERTVRDKDIVNSWRKIQCW